jgi:hypothetical protein
MTSVELIPPHLLKRKAVVNPGLGSTVVQQLMMHWP